MFYGYLYSVVIGYYLWFYLKLKKDPNYRVGVSVCVSIMLVELVMETASIERKKLSYEYYNALFAFFLIFALPTLQFIQIAKRKARASGSSAKEDLKRYFTLQLGVIGISLLFVCCLLAVVVLFSVLIPKNLQSNSFVSVAEAVVVSLACALWLYLILRWGHEKQRKIEEVLLLKQDCHLNDEEKSSIEIWYQARLDSYLPLSINTFFVFLALWFVISFNRFTDPIHKVLLLLGAGTCGALVGYAISLQMVKKMKQQAIEAGIPWEVFESLIEKGIIRGRGFKKGTHFLFIRQK